MILRLRRPLGLTVAAGSLALLAALSGWRLGGTAEGAALRVAFSGRPELLEHCRELGEEELASRPAHMRQRLECEGRYATYRLTIRIGDSVFTNQVHTGGGIRRDRPLTVLEDFFLTPGSRQLHVILARVEAADSAQPLPADSTRRARHPPLPARLELHEAITLERGRVLVLSYDPELRQLLLQRHRGPP